MKEDRSLDPFDGPRARPYLEALAARAEAGECVEKLRQELFDRLWPWGLKHARSVSSRSPEGADRAEITSNILFALYRACEAIDWEQWKQWPSFLATMLNGARIDAARTDDILSRRQRAVRSAFQRARDQEVQATGRKLSHDEEQNVLRTISPATAEDPYLSLLVRHEIRRETTDGLELGSSTADPSSLVLDSFAAQAVRRWVHHDLPPHLRADVLRWVNQQRRHEQLPRRTYSQLRPYIPQLVRRVSDEEMGDLVTGPTEERRAS